MGDKPEYKFANTSLENIDYVLVHEKIDPEPDTEKNGKLTSYGQAKHDRELFEEKLRELGIEIEKFEDGENNVFTKLCVSFDRLCDEAEDIKLEFPLADCKVYDDPVFFVEKFEEKYLVTDDEDDFVSAFFKRDKLHLYLNHENPETFWRPGLRIFLTYHILINADIRKKIPTADTEGHLSKMALPNLLISNAYTDAFCLHDPSAESRFIRKLKKEWLKRSSISDVVASPEEALPEIEKGKKLECIKSIGNVRFDHTYTSDTRKKLDETWTKVYKYQPMWKIRNYFGEKIAFYFAWTGHMITYLWLPTLFGLVVFFYGLSLSINRHNTVTPTTPLNLTTSRTTVSSLTQIKALVDDMLSVVKEAFDNEVTPYFALLICLWGTLFTETWKRRRATLAYEWDVVNFDASEPDRPEFVGTTKRKDPVTQMDDLYYPFTNQLMKLGSSFAILVFMICIVFVSVAAVIVYRVVMTVRFCQDLGSTGCLMVSTIGSSVLNAVSILLLGKVYDYLAVVLTDWENHRAQSAYDDALIIKLFAFQFANSYSSLFYIAFFRGEQSLVGTQSNGIFGLGPNYTDTCGTGNNCMSMLSFQVLILMIVKPMPKLFKDVVLPFAMKIMHMCCKKCRTGGKVEDEEQTLTRPDDSNAYVLNEYRKPPLQDFTISEYMEKIIQYGYLMIFAASFPLAPLIALLTNLIDVVVDAKRMLWLFRRPVPHIVQDIGMWESIVEFVNICGVVSNAFIIAFTSAWGKKYSTTTKLIIVLAIEHAVFGLKFLLAAIIPDEPRQVTLSKRREKYQVQLILDEGDVGAAKGSKANMREDVIPVDDPGDNNKKGGHSDTEPLFGNDIYKEDDQSPSYPGHRADDNSDEDNTRRRRKKKRKHRRTRSEDPGPTDDYDGGIMLSPIGGSNRSRINEEDDEDTLA